MRPLLDPRAAWDALTPAQQRAIGAAALAVCIGADAPHVDERWHWDTAEIESVQALRAAVRCAGVSERRVDLGVFGVRMCHGCDCTTDCACAPGCHWVGDTLCSRCLPPPKRRRRGKPAQEASRADQP
jgi:hypothetical protein